MSTFDDMVSFLDQSWEAKGFIVPLLLGPAGIGKTAAVHQHAKNVNAGKVVTIIASQILPNEVSGITMPVVESKSMEIFDHYRLSSLQDGDILFFDELLESDQLVLSACLTLIESRELMSGHKLPDIQIVAATNATIKPNMLKESIRQRFVWQDFKIDPEGCRAYIEKTYGINVHKLIPQLTATGSEYNILTPRSLTKMSAWICSAKDAYQAEKIAAQIDRCWKSSLGTELLNCWVNYFENPMHRVQNAVTRILREKGYTAIKGTDLDLIDFKVTTLPELMEIIQTLPEWNEIEAEIASLEVEVGNKYVTES